MDTLTVPSQTQHRPRWPQLAYLINLICQCGIVVTGGAVRLTGSGLGCPTWPECVPGSFTPVMRQAQGFHKYIEFGNRLLTFVVLLAAVAAVIAAWRHARHRRSSRILSATIVTGVVAQAVIGGITVLLDLHPMVVGVHMLVSLKLVSTSAWLFLSERQSAPVSAAPSHGRAPVIWVLVALVAATLVVVVLGVLTTGAGPLSGDADIPSRLQVDPQLLSRLHAASVWAFVLGLAVFGWLTRATQWRHHTQWWVWATAAITVAQGGVGYVQYFTGLPELLVGIHMLGSCLVIIAVTGLVRAVSRQLHAAASGRAEQLSVRTC